MAAEPAFPSSLRVALVGAGSVGTAVATLLKDRGHHIAAIWSRSMESAARAAERLEAPIAESPQTAVADTDVVLLGAVDSVVRELARDVAPGLRARAVAVHFSGSLGIAPLEAVREMGAYRAALHPVQSVPDAGSGIDRLPGSAWGITCDAAVHGWARTVVERDLGGIPVDVAEEDRAPWHAAAVMTSNGVAALVSTAAALLARIGVDEPHAVLGPLAAGTLTNIKTLGGDGDAFTGPVVRGDRATVERHLAALTARFPDLLDEYKLIARAIVAGAARTARIETSTARSMQQLLEPA
jgi:predicted short-subunit dehydrogenase-like oxidoreductase (DUF2520 family)